MQHTAHSDWTFDYALGHHLNTSVDPTSADAGQSTQHLPQTDSIASVLKTLWHSNSTGSSASSTGGSSGSSVTSDASGSSVPPTLTVTSNALTVNAGGSVSLPISVSPASGHTSVTIAGLTNYETVTDSLDGKTFTPGANGSVTLSAAEVSSGLSLASNYTGSDHPVNTLTVMAADTIGHHALTSASQTITVTDPPASTAGSGSSTSSGSDTLTLQVSGDQYNGDPQIEVFVDGQQIGGTYTVTADHSSGQTQTITITGNFDPSVAHQVQVEFVNDAWDGTSWWSNGGSADGHDRNVYVESISLNGQTLEGSQGTDGATNGVVPAASTNEAVMDVNGTLAFNVPAASATTTGAGTGGASSGTTGPTTATSSGSGTLTLQVSGDQYNGDPQIVVLVDGQQVGTYTVTADHASGQTQTITISGNFDPNVAHQVQVEFTNDSWDGTSWWSDGGSADGHDRNVYVESISLNGQSLEGSQGTDGATNGVVPAANANEAVMDVNGTLTFNVPDPPATTSAGSSGSGSSASSTSTSTSTDPTTSAVGTGASDPPQTTNAYYVSPNGSDSNPGTLAAPFATLARAQQAMENGSIKTTYVEEGTYNLTSTLTLTGADSGETWQYYAPNGVDTAILDGGGSTATGIEIQGATNVTIDGLTVQNFTTIGIDASNTSGVTIENCNVGFITNPSDVPSAGISVGLDDPNGQGSVVSTATISNNYVHDTASFGIAAYAYYTGQSVNGTVITGNVLLRDSTVDEDTGAIYVNMNQTGDSGGHVTISNNYVADYGASTVSGNGQHAVYLDDNSSNVTVTGNVLAPPAAGSINNGNINNASSILVHNGNNNTITDNLLDLGSSGMNMAVVWGQDSGSLAGMAGNTFTNNIVISSFSGSQQTSASGAVGYTYWNTGNATISNNVYYNYAGGEVVTTSAQGNGDTNPILENPQISGGNLYTIASGSPVFNSPVNFTPTIGGWGPQGFTIPSSTNDSDS
jgi:hypothetical protein